MFTTQLLDVMTTAGVLYIVALGLLIVYGVLKIINLAHGAFLAMGAYAGVIATRAGWNPWTALLLAFAIGVAVAALVEWRVLGSLYPSSPPGGSTSSSCRRSRFISDARSTLLRAPSSERWTSAA
jgi:branched-subunit amino acid ABC-type transport system permease component